MKKSINILLQKLKDKGINRHVICPSVKRLISVFANEIENPIDIIDERSAGYVASGICEETNEPVVIWCADNDSYRNLTSALTEAYYKKLPILVVAIQVDENINQIVNPIDIIRYYVNIVPNEGMGCEAEIDKAIKCLSQQVKGPVYLSLKSYSETKNADVLMQEDKEHIDATPLFRVIPEGSCVHIGRYITYNFNFKEKIEIISRDDHCTDDGNFSMIIGSAIAAPDQLHLGIFTSDELTYDINMLGNRHVGSNIIIFAMGSDRQSPSIYNFAKRMGWICRRVAIYDLKQIEEGQVKDAGPHYIEVTI